MKIEIQSLHFTLHPELNNFILDKVNKLGHFQTGIIAADVCVKLDNAGTQDNKICEIRLEIPGYDLFVKKHGNTFEEATMLAIEAMEHQIEKHKRITDRKVEEDLL